MGTDFLPQQASPSTPPPQCGSHAPAELGAFCFMATATLVLPHPLGTSPETSTTLPGEFLEWLWPSRYHVKSGVFAARAA